MPLPLALPSPTGPSANTSSPLAAHRKIALPFE